MKQELDAYAHLDSPLHRWENRYKIAGLFLLAFAFAFVEDVRLLPALVVITAVLFWLSNLPFSFLSGRLKIPGLILFGIVVSLPFLSGSTVLASLGPISIKQEGVMAALIIAVRFVCIITLSLLIFSTDTLVNTLKGMIGLRMPPILADMVLLTYRYIFDLSASFRTTQTAVRLRGFQNNKLSGGKLNTLAALMGNLIVRSYEQSERVYKAMILRGYGMTDANPAALTSTLTDKLWLAAILLLAIGLVSAQLFLNL